LNLPVETIPPVGGEQTLTDAAIYEGVKPTRYQTCYKQDHHYSPENY
jgi:hypothetical protein